MKKGKWYKKISNWIVILACIVLIPILIFNIAIMIQANMNKDEVPSVFGYKPFIVLSGSMETKIHKGDLIITKIVDPETLKKGDIIAFRDAQGTVTTHRIVDTEVHDGITYFVTRGDNNSSNDQNLVEYDDVEGIYIRRIPSIGSMMDSLSKPTTMVILILGVTIIFGIGFTISNRNQRKIEQAEFLEYKKMKELEAKEQEEKEETPKKTNTTKKTSKKSTTKKTTEKKTSKK